MMETVLSLPVIVTAVVILVSLIWRLKKLPKHPKYSLPLASAATAKSVAFDVIVVGAGPAGIAAAHQAHIKGLSVLLVDEGPIGIARGPFATADVPSFTLEAMGSVVDSGNERATLPLVGALLTKRLSADPANTPQEPQRDYTDVKTRYSRGHGLGGTTMFDWGQLFTSPFTFGRNLTMSVVGNNNGALEARRVPFALPKTQSPLSWAFNEAVKATNMEGKEEGDEKEQEGYKDDDESVQDPTKWSKETYEQSITGEFPPPPSPLSSSHHHQPSTLRAFVTPCRFSTIDGMRVSIARALLGKRPSKPLRGISILATAKVIGFTFGEEKKEGASKKVTEITVRVPTEKGLVKIGEGITLVNDGKHMLINLRCKRGVILCAGVIHTPQLLRMVVSPPTAAAPVDLPLLPFNDVMGYPMIFQTQPGLSSDASNTHTWRSLASWFFGGTGPALNPVSDTAAVVNVPSHPGARLLLQLVPSGGFNRHRFAALGVAIPLGVFKEAIIINVSLLSLPTALSHHPIGQLSFKDDGSPLVRGNLDPASRSTVIDCLSYGIPVCRSLVQTPPLSALCKQEALDTTLFTTKERDLVVRTLYQSTSKAQKLSPQQLQLGRAIASTIGISKDYIQCYVAKHTRFMGYGSGSAAPFMIPKATTTTASPSSHVSGHQLPSSRVQGVKNLYVGDASCFVVGEEKEEEHLKGGMTLLGVGGVAGAMSLGSAAANDLISSAI